MIRVRINSKLELKSRELAMKRLGCGKGSLTRAVEDAILKWISSVGKEEPTFEGDPVEAIDGIISDVKMSSVKLQHKIKDIWMSRVLGNVSSRLTLFLKVMPFTEEK